MKQTMFVGKKSSLRMLNLFGLKKEKTPLYTHMLPLLSQTPHSQVTQEQGKIYLE